MKPYNPSAWPPRFRMILIALVATLISIYLSLYEWKLIDSVWDPFFGDGSEIVLRSDLSHLFTSWIRIPDAFLGTFAYLADIVFALAGSSRRWQDRPWLVIVFGISVIPVGCVSILLVILQGFVIHSLCFFCLVSALCSLILIFLAYGEVIASCHYLLEIWKRSNVKTVWWAFSGYPSPEAYPAAEVILKRRGRYVGKNR